ncbi:MAG: 16S rRNA (cytidine1402-2'-O)-methyltransferase, partial [Flammeovirgaceae bacterium]
DKLLEELVQVCNPQTLLSIARNITTEKELVKTMEIKDWIKKKPSLHKQPCIFSIGNLR